MEIIRHTESEIHIRLGGNTKVFKFWIWGEGLIPLHEKPSIWEDLEPRAYAKEYLFGKANRWRRAR